MHYISAFAYIGGTDVSFSTVTHAVAYFTNNPIYKGISLSRPYNSGKEG